jgi:hypothetical protein
MLLRGHRAVELAEGRISQVFSPSNRNGGDVLAKGSSDPWRTYGVRLLPTSYTGCHR